MNKATIFDYVRLCKYYEKDCRKCPLHISSNGMRLYCDEFISNTTDKANEIILNWCKEHPVETRQDRFLKMFPNAALFDKILGICPERIDIESGIDCEKQSCGTCRKNYWLAEVEESE